MKTPRYTDQHRYPNGYKRSAETNIDATFKRVRAEQQRVKDEQAVKVQPLKRATK